MIPLIGRGGKPLQIGVAALAPGKSSRHVGRVRCVRSCWLPKLAPFAQLRDCDASFRARSSAFRASARSCCRGKKSPRHSHDRVRSLFRHPRYPLVELTKDSVTSRCAQANCRRNRRGLPRLKGWRLRFCIHWRNHALDGKGERAKAAREGLANRALCGFCYDWLFWGYSQTFSQSHRGVVTTYALEVGATGDYDNRDQLLSAPRAARYSIHEILPFFHLQLGTGIFVPFES
jgi:hypothetical protein